jgi:hypothetical protein
MVFSVNSLKTERITPDGKLVEPNPKKGLKWGFLAAITVLALAILGAFLITALALSISNFVTGVGIFTGICLMGSAIVDSLPFGYITAIAVQCILNAKHHCKKTRPMQPVIITQYPTTTYRYAKPNTR